MGGKASIIRVKNKYYTRGAGLYQRARSCQTHAGRGTQEWTQKRRRINKSCEFCAFLWLG